MSNFLPRPNWNNQEVIIGTARPVRTSRYLKEWNDIILDLADGHNGNNIESVVKSLSLAASVYFIWNERNNRIFREEDKNTEEVTNKILDIVKMKMLSLKVKNSFAVKNVERRWSIEFKKKS